METVVVNESIKGAPNSNIYFLTSIISFKEQFIKDFFPTRTFFTINRIDIGIG